MRGGRVARHERAGYADPPATARHERAGLRRLGKNEVEAKLINLAKSLARKMKTGQDWNSDYKT